MGLGFTQQQLLKDIERVFSVQITYDSVCENVKVEKKLEEKLKIMQTVLVKQ